MRFMMYMTKIVITFGVVLAVIVLDWEKFLWASDALQHTFGPGFTFIIFLVNIIVTLGLYLSWATYRDKISKEFIESVKKDGTR